jgi:hypothetical protein
MTTRARPETVARSAVVTDAAYRACLLLRTASVGPPTHARNVAQWPTA